MNVGSSLHHEAPYVDDVGDNDPKRGSSQLLCVLGFCHLDSRVNFASSNQLLFCGGRGGGGEGRLSHHSKVDEVRLRLQSKADTYASSACLLATHDEKQETLGFSS